MRGRDGGRERAFCGAVDPPRSKAVVMALDDFLVGVLVDPIDHEPLLYLESRSLLYNPRRRVAYEVRGSIPDMLPSEARAVDDAEHAALTSDAAAVQTGPQH
jgi:uncharacterized protein